MAEEQLTLIKKLAKIRAIADSVKKDKKGYNYTYADITEILAKVTAGMKKYGVSLIPSIVPESAMVEQNVVVNTKFDKQGKAYDQTVTEMLFSADMIFKWVNDDNVDDFINVPWFVTGAQGDPSQALGSGLTYCTRYFLTSYFQIAQSNLDADAYRSKQREAEAAEDKAVAEEIINKFDSSLKTYLAENPKNKDDVLKFVTKYVKSGNYKTIAEPALASKLLKDFREKYLKSEEE